MGLKLLKHPYKCKYCRRLIYWESWKSKNGCLWCDENHPNNRKDNKSQLNNIDTTK